MLDVERFALCRNSLLYRDDMHSDSGSARCYHLCNACERKVSHALEEVSNLRSLTHYLISHYHDLCGARYILVEYISSLMLRILTVLVLVIPLDEAVLTKSFKHCRQMIVIIAGQFFHLCESFRLALSHHKSSVKTILCNVLAVSPDDILIAAVHSPIFRRIDRRFLKSEEDFLAVSDDLYKLKDLLVVAQLFSLFCHTFPSLSLTISISLKMPSIKASYLS